MSDCRDTGGYCIGGCRRIGLGVVRKLPCGCYACYCGMCAQDHLEQDVLKITERLASLQKRHTRMETLWANERDEFEEMRKELAWLRGELYGIQSELEPGPGDQDQDPSYL